MKKNNAITTSASHKRKVQGYKYFLLIVPFLILCFLFSYFPLHGWLYAFYDYKPALGLSGSQFVGTKWFTLLFGNATQMKELGRVMKNTFAMSFLTIATSVLPMFFAIFLSEIKNKKFRTLVQTFTTLPNFISWVLVYSVAFSLFSTTGMLNTVLQNSGITDAAIRFLDTDKHVWLTMLLWNLWKTLGWNSIMYLAAIAGIDQEMYEAARVDGANRFKLMRYITLPALMPTFFVLLMLSVANILTNGMDQYYVFQNAFNKTNIEVLDLYVYNIGMTSAGYSLATAVSMMKSLVSVALLFTVNFLSKKLRGESIV